MNRRGFTLIELLVGVILVGIVSLSIYQLLINNQRMYRQQTERADLNTTLRGAVAIVPTELREANARDTVESDITVLSPTSVTFKAMRTLHFLCAVPVDNGATGTLTVWRNPSFGMRGLDPARDSVVLFAEGDPATRTDNYWLHANLASIATGTACPGGAASVTLNLASVHPVGGLGAVTDGAPVRAFEVVQLLTYTDAGGESWMGARRFAKGGGWTTTQPVLGPLESGGLTLSYFDTLGAATTTPSEVARIGISVSGMTREPVRTAGGLQHVIDTLSTQVALRNNTR
jgi:prepilin-type N-terminal cleavage/methylation domain-containing protein